MPGSERRPVDDEPVAHVRGQDALPRLVDPVSPDELDVRGDAVLGAEVEHLLRLADRPDRRAGAGPALEEQPRRGERHALPRGRAAAAARITPGPCPAKVRRGRVGGSAGTGSGSGGAPTFTSAPSVRSSV